MKKCTRCQIEKDLSQFNKDKSRVDGLDATCKACKSKSKKKEYWSTREKYLAKCKEYDAKRNPIRIKAGYWKKWHKKNKDKNNQYCKKWREANREKVQEYSRKRLVNNLSLRLANRISTDIGDCLSGRKNKRKWQSLVGYTLEDLKARIESEMGKDMTWDNWGRGSTCWHIDHIRPQSWFNFTDEVQIKKCWVLSNLTCKWEYDNISKSNKFEG